MLVQVLTVSVAELEQGERAVVSRVLREECAATCDTLAGVVAHRWSVNERTHSVAGLVQWADDAAMRGGTEALSMVVATVHPDRFVPTHREFPSPVPPSSMKEKQNRTWEDDRPNTGFVKHPEDYDPRG